MPLYSRSQLVWRAPETSASGDPLDYELDYELGAREAGTSNPFVALYAVIGSLQPDSTYVAQIDQMSFDLGSYDVALRAVNRDDPTKASEWSNSLGLVVSSDPTPAAPILLDA